MRGIPIKEMPNTVDEIIMSVQKVGERYHCSFSICPDVLKLEAKAKHVVLRNYDGERHDRKLLKEIKEKLNKIISISQYEVDLEEEDMLSEILEIACELDEKIGDV